MKGYFSFQPPDAAGFNAAYAQIYGRQPIESELNKASQPIIVEKNGGEKPPRRCS